MKNQKYPLICHMEVIVGNYQQLEVIVERDFNQSVEGRNHTASDFIEMGGRER